MGTSCLTLVWVPAHFGGCLMRHLMQFANARGWTPQRADIFGEKYLFSGYQPCLICIHMTRGDNSKPKSFLKGCMHSDAVSLPLPGCRFPASKRSQRDGAPRSEPRGGAPAPAESPRRAQPRSRVCSGPPGAVQRGGTAARSPWQSPSARPRPWSRLDLHGCQGNVYHETAGEANTWEKDQAGSIFCKSLVRFWVTAIMAPN